MESPLQLPPIPPPPKTKRFSTIILIALVLVSLVAGCGIGYAVTYADFNNKLSNIQGQLGLYQGTSTNSQTYLLNDNVSLSTLYQNTKSSVVMVQDLVQAYSMFGAKVYSLQQGSGFITKVNNQLVVVTNNHVVDGAINVTVTFADGNSHPATITGQDAKADLAVLSVPSMPSDVTPLTLVSSSTLNVGDPVVAVGSPYGLSGTLTSGIISALGRTIVEESTSNQNGQTIADIIQTSTAINSGNSGGPLLNYAGQVVGITTAAVKNSQGLGFAIPSATLMRELPSLVTYGYYDQHPSINAVGRDMNYQIAQAMDSSVTYGWIVEKVSVQNGLQGGTTYTSILGSNIAVGGDVIVAINNVRIANADDLLSYLERNTLPGQTVSFMVVRNGQMQNVQVTIGKA